MRATREINIRQKESDVVSSLGIKKRRSSEPPKEFTDIVGSSGKWQIRILIVTIIGIMPVAWNHMAMPFLAFDYDYWCARPEPYNRTIQNWWTEAHPNETSDGNAHHNKCEMFDFNVSANGNFTIRQCRAFEYEEKNRNTIIKQWDLVCDNEWLVSMSTSVYMAGFFVSVILSGQLADIYGRRPIILLNVIIILISGISVTLSTSFIMFTIMRFFVAMGQSGLSLTLFVLVIELVGSDHRGVYYYVQTFGWSAGYCSLPLLAYYIDSWRYLQLAITLPSLTLLSFYWLIPESPRWLLANGKLNQAIAVMKKAARENGAKVTNLEAEARKLCTKAENENEMENRATVLDLLRTPNMRKKTLNLYFSWIVIAFVYFGLSLNTGELGGNPYLNFFFFGLVEIPALFFCLFVRKRFGRRNPFMCALIFCGVACIGFIFIPTDIRWLKIVMALLGKFLVSTAFRMVYIYSAEIYPTVARNVGVGSSSTMARIGSILAPFVKELGKFTDPCVPMGLFGLLSIVSGCLVWFLPETVGQPVPETLKQAEEFGKKNSPSDMELETAKPV